MVADGIRGVTANPTIFARAIEGSSCTTSSSASLVARRPYRCSTPTGSSSSPTSRTRRAVLRPTFDASGGTDGFVSIEVAPELARDTDTTVTAARDLHQRIALPNLFVKIPATAEGIPAIRDDDRRRSQHQRHPHLLAGSLRTR